MFWGFFSNKSTNTHLQNWKCCQIPQPLNSSPEDAFPTKESESFHEWVLFQYIPSQIGKSRETAGKIQMFIIKASIEYIATLCYWKGGVAYKTCVSTSWIELSAVFVVEKMSPSVQECVSKLFRCYSHVDIQVRSGNGHPSALFLLSRNIPETHTGTQTCTHRVAALKSSTYTQKSCIKQQL